jgi:mannose-1-phosphate guanylyltransferase
MAGGRGERLWPLSTPTRPKQFLKLSGKRTMLQETIARVNSLIPEERVYVVTPGKFAALVHEQLDIPPSNVIVEPIGRNTAPCIGLAAIILETSDPQGVMVVLPADHVIKQPERFMEILSTAVDIAGSEDYLITLGVVPDHPSTGYGYIQRGAPFPKSRNIKAYEAKRFTEKPDEATARRFLREGGYYWNSGMFIWRVDMILAEIERHMPNLYARLQEIKQHLDKPDRNAVIERVYQEQEPISIDYGLMERSENVVVIPADIGWSDVGDWSALAAILEKDENENIVHAKHVGIDTQDSVIYSTGDKLIATIGLANIVIVETEETLLVMDKARSQDVRKIVGGH